jgi:CRP-like cAMP-binding protein
LELGEEVYNKYGRKYKDNEVIFNDGDQGDAMYIIYEGEVKIFKDIEGRRTTLATLKEGDFFGEMALIENKPRSAGASAKGNTKLIELNREVFEESIKTNPEIIMAILKEMSERLREADQQIKLLMLKSNSSKVAGTLMLLSNQHGDKNEDGSININAKLVSAELDNMIDLPWEKISEVLKMMVRAKVISKEGLDIVIQSEEELQKFMSYLEMKEEFGL